MAGKKFIGTIGKTLADTTFAFQQEPSPSAGKPNVIYIVLDDVGFAELGCYGSEIHTPNIDRIAENGIRYNNFHTTAVCSATRASLLTGANHHAAGVAGIVESGTGISNALGKLNPAYATVAEILKEYDYKTIAIGKWHLCDKASRTAAGPYENWPLGKGFDNYYGFLDAAMDQWNPILTRDNSRVGQKKSAAEGYHLSEDLTENAIHYIYDHVNAYPEKPFFLYLAYGAMHAPLQAPKEYIDRYRGRYDAGWEVLRKERFDRQKQLGIIPEDAELTEPNVLVPDWDCLEEKEKKAFARLMEVYAGFLEHTDEQIGKLLDYLEETEQSEDTIIVLLSDNGASAEGGRFGHYHHHTSVDVVEDYPKVVEQVLEHYETVGDEFSSPHYAIGWANAGNTPFQWYKTWVHEGGVKDPLIISYPKGIREKGGVRGQFVHVSDITPTILDILGYEKPAVIKGVSQLELQGKSFKKTIGDKEAIADKRIQYFEMYGNRAIYKDGWKAVANHAFHDSYEEDLWELYHVTEDYSEKYNVADRYPEKVKELREAWFAEAGKYGVFPLGPGSLLAKKETQAEVSLERTIPEKKRIYKQIRYPFTIPDALMISRETHRILAEIELISGSDQGVILANGDRFGGSVLYIQEGYVKYVYNFLDEKYYSIKTKEKVAAGKHKLEVFFEVAQNWSAVAKLYVDGKEAGKIFIDELNKFATLMETTIKANFQSEISQDYTSPFEFDGIIKTVEIRMAPSGVVTKDMIEAFLRED
ncbi:MAG: arylsulfatase [Clostridiaceae bacterium]|nr:arylsulfatase [Clostridiaceae bacterium]